VGHVQRYPAKTFKSGIRLSGLGKKAPNKTYAYDYPILVQQAHPGGCAPPWSDSAWRGRSSMQPRDYRDYVELEERQGSLAPVCVSPTSMA